MSREVRLDLKLRFLKVTYKTESDENLVFESMRGLNPSLSSLPNP